MGGENTPSCFRTHCFHQMCAALVMVTFFAAIIMGILVGGWSPDGDMAKAEWTNNGSNEMVIKEGNAAKHVAPEIENGKGIASGLLGGATAMGGSHMAAIATQNKNIRKKKPHLFAAYGGMMFFAICLFAITSCACITVQDRTYAGGPNIAANAKVINEGVGWTIFGVIVLSSCTIGVAGCIPYILLHLDQKQRGYERTDSDIRLDKRIHWNEHHKDWYKNDTELMITDKGRENHFFDRTKPNGRYQNRFETIEGLNTKSKTCCNEEKREGFKIDPATKKRIERRRLSCFPPLIKLYEEIQLAQSQSDP